MKILSILVGAAQVAVALGSAVFPQVPFGAQLNWCDRGLHAALRDSLSILLRDLSRGVVNYSFQPGVFEATEVMTQAVEQILRELLYFGGADGGAVLSMSGASNALTPLLELLQSALQLFKKVETVATVSRMEQLATSMCRIIDREAATLADGFSPIGCFAQNLAVTLSACSVSLRTNLAHFRDCEVGGAADRSGRLELIPDFPERERCFTHTGETFRWDDPDLSIPLTLVNETYAHAVPRAVRERELLTYLTLWRASQIVYRATYPKCARAYAPVIFEKLALVPGWETTDIVWVTEAGSKTQIYDAPVTLPLAFILRPARPSSSCKVLVLFRGTQTDYEWFLDFYYHKYPTRRPETSLPIGVKSFVDALYDPVRLRVTAALAPHCSCSETQVIFAGHSLGGALALSFATLYQYDLERRECSPTVYSVSLSSPRILDGAHPRVVYRSIIDRKDILFSFPCFNGHFEDRREGNSYLGWPRCGRGNAGLAGRGADNFPTPPGRVLVDAYIGATASIEERFRHDQEAFDTSQEYAALLPSLDPAAAGNVTEEAWPPRRGRLSLLAAPTFILKSLRWQDVVYQPPTRDDIINGHTTTLSCILGSACRGRRESRFDWRCGKS